jgi:signal transduction histidine kinase
MQRVHKPYRKMPADGNRGFDRIISQLCGAFVRATIDEIDEEINRWLRRIVTTLALDRATLAEINSSGWGAFSHGWARDPEQIIRRPLDVNILLPWLLRKVIAGETVIIPKLDDLPEEAAIDRESFRRHGTKSNVTIPIRAGHEVIGGVGFATMYQERDWPPEIVEQLELVTEIFGYALQRKKSVGEIHRLRDELTHVSRVTTLSQLASSIAHELNQPLAAIMNNAEAAQLYLAAAPRNLEAAGLAQKAIISDVQRASDIVVRFRQFFKRHDLHKSTLSPNELMVGVEPILRSRATITGVFLHFESATRLPSVSADRLLIEQVLINLVLNAFDAVLSVAEGPHEVEVSAFKGENGFVNFAVRDTGTGIQPDLMPRLFDSFFTTKPNGLGMGLGIARSIVEAHGGRIWATQNADRGATFDFSLPAETRRS